MTGRLAKVAIAAALAFTLVLGVWMRWFLGGRLGLPTAFPFMRHAHSHMGYYGVLFPMAWLAWRRVRAPIPAPRTTGLYAAATVLAAAGFLRAGYGPEAIAASTIIGAIWLHAAWNLRHRARDLRDPLVATIPGVVLALCCIPPIALNLRTEPAVAASWVQTFLAVLLLGVLVPSALRRPTPWPLLLLGAVSTAARLGVWPHPITSAGTVLYAALLLYATRRTPPHERWPWVAVSAGLTSIALGVLPDNRPVALGAIHFLVLGPLLATLAPLWLRRSPPPWAWWIGHAAVATMTGALVAEGLGAGAWTPTTAAVGGTAIALWWLGVAIWTITDRR